MTSREIVPSTSNAATRRLSRHASPPWRLLRWMAASRITFCGKGANIMITDETLGWRLRQYRVQAHMKQEDIAKILGRDATAITKIESNQRKVSAREVALFAAAYNVPIEILLGKDGQPAEPVSIGLKRL